MGTHRRRPAWRQAALLVGGGLVSAVLVVEFALRALTGTLFDWGPLHHWDPVVGRMYRPGIAWRHPAKGFTFTIGAHGVRSNGQPAPAGPTILAVGDSFTFGEDVDDAETWPAALELRTGMPVANGGVPGFGFDQTVLRAEQLAAVFAPDTVVASFIPLDVSRSEMSISGHAKPYFDIEGDALIPRPAPAVHQPRSRRLLSRSVAAELLFARSLRAEGPEYFLVHRRGLEVSCRLMQRLAALRCPRAARVVLLAQPQALHSEPGDVAIKDALLACAAAADIPSLDLFPVLDALPAAQRTPLFENHMTAAGNRWVADRVAEFLARLPLPAPCTP